MHVVVVANGELPPQNDGTVANLLKVADLVIAADGGLTHCRTFGIWPDIIVGDLDSASTEHVEQARTHGARVVSYPVDKNATDLELALIESTTADATQVTVVAAFGGRLDHELATISLLASDQWASLAVRAIDGRRQLWIVRTQLHVALPVGATISLLPWAGDVAGVATVGLQWPLHNETLRLGSTRGVSNVAEATEQVVTIGGGTLLVVADED